MRIVQLHLSIKTTLVCLLLSVTSNAQSAPRNLVGVVVAYKKVNRCPSCDGSNGGIGIQIEYWIVRVDDSGEKKFKGDRYILVEYQMYQRSLSDSEINEKLRFEIRERQEHEKNHDCVGDIGYKEGEDYFLRPASGKDFERTRPGEDDKVPTDLKTLPCFIVERLPKVIG